MSKLSLWIATFFYIGKFPIAPGTLTSLVTATTFFLVNRYAHLSLYGQLAAIVIIFFIGIPVATAGEKYFGKKDPRPVVIDEVAGQMVALLWVPCTIGLYFLGFLLFRFFDILKPFPVGLADRKLSHGFGIMADDILAALYALGTIHLILYLWPKIF
jgi:phosphatidylglycerophosphatase A